MTDCVFCKIIAGEIPAYKIYEDDQVLVFLDINPVNAGHALVVPKEHYPDFLSLPSALVERLSAVIQKVTPAILAGVSAENFNLGLNNGPVAGQVVPHVHWHIMPRFPDDGHRLFSGRQYSEGEIEVILDKIRNNLRV